MPYIDRQRRSIVDPLMRDLLKHAETATDGELNYTITRLLLARLGPAPRYTDFNAMMGVLSCVGHELYREQIARYEDTAKVAHGPLTGGHDGISR